MDPTSCSIRPTTFESFHLEQIHRGKVRDTYEFHDHSDLLLQIASDRISIFDFVLPAEVPDKGAILTAMTVFWMTRILSTICDNHLVAYGGAVEEYFPLELRRSTDRQSRSLVVKRLTMLPIECIVRGYLTGNGWKSYQESGAVCGHTLPEGLHDGSKLPKPLFTPTTKAQEGHDEDLDAQKVTAEFGTTPECLSLDIYRAAADHAASRGILIADTKFEFGEGFVLADEVLTADSSRFWLESDWEKAAAQRKSPSGYDKQFAREWGKTVETPFKAPDETPIVGIHKLDPKNQKHRAFVRSIRVPESVLEKTSELYHAIFRRLVGDTLTVFQTWSMGIT